MVQIKYLLLHLPIVLIRIFHMKLDGDICRVSLLLESSDVLFSLFIVFLASFLLIFELVEFVLCVWLGLILKIIVLAFRIECYLGKYFFSLPLWDLFSQQLLLFWWNARFFYLVFMSNWCFRRWVNLNFIKGFLSLFYWILVPFSEILLRESLDLFLTRLLKHFFPLKWYLRR